MNSGLTNKKRTKEKRRPLCLLRLNKKIVPTVICKSAADVSSYSGYFLNY